MRLIFLFIFLSSCLTQKKASKRIEKIAAKYPDEVINKAERLVPLDTFDFYKWKTEADSIFKDYIAKADTIDNISNSETITECNEIIKNNVKFITTIREKIINAPPIYRTDTTKIITLQRNIDNAKKQIEKLKRISWIYLGAGLSLFALLLLILINKYRR